MNLADSELFTNQRAARDRLLHRLVELLRQDARISAVWLIGSLGREQYDELSDLDVWVVVADAYLERWLAGREQFMLALGKPLVLYDVPANAPRGGAFMTVLFDGPVGPLTVDWYWEPQSHAHLPRDVRLIFDRVGLTIRSELPVSHQDLAAHLTRKAEYFWAMLPIAAKKIYRNQEWDALSMIIMLRDVLHQVGALAGAGLPPDQDRPPTSRLTQLEYLRGMATQMQAMEPAIAMLGGVVPSKAAVAVCNFLDTVGAGIQQYLKNSPAKS